MLVMITLVPGEPREMAEQAPVYVFVFDSHAKCTSQANASNSTDGILTQNTTLKANQHLFECIEERVH